MSDVSTGPDVVKVTEFATLPSVAAIVAVPCATALTTPVADTPATDEFEVVQFTVDVKFCVEPSEYVPVAVSCVLSPAAAVGLGGVIEIDCNVAEVIVSVAPLLVTPDSDAVMVAEPADTPVATPLALIDAADDDDCQETCELRSCVEPSEKVPVAVNCSVVPEAIDADAGVTLMEFKAAEVIVTEIDCVMLPDVAVTVAFPCPTPVATPVLETETTPLEEEVQLIELVRSCVDPSL